MLLGLNMCISCAAAQESKKHPVYILPDGRVLAPDKLDSLIKVWGRERIMVKHDSEDDKKGVVHLVRITDEMKAKLEQDNLNNEKEVAAMIDKPAPDFDLTDLQGKHWTLNKLRGKVVVLNFWFTSCPPCIKEMPELNKLVQANDPKQVLFLGVTFNNAKEVNDFLKEHAFAYTLLPNSEKVDTQYHINGWPTSFVIDRNGVLKVMTHYSDTIQEELQTAINLALK